MNDLILNNPKTFADVYRLYEQDCQSKSSPDKVDLLAFLRTTLFRYVLPKFGFPLREREGQKLTLAESKAAWELMERIPISELNNVLCYQEEVFQASKSTTSSCRTYRMHLKKFLSWCQQQPWWKWAVLVEKKHGEKRCPKTKGKRSIKKDKPRLTEKEMTPASSQFCYGLKPSEISPSLQQELDGFFNFQTAVVGSRHRQDKALRPVSAKGHVKAAIRLLGWLHRYQDVSLQDLSLKRLVPKSGLTPEGNRDEAGIDEVMDLIDTHLQWLRESRDASPNTELKAVECFVAVAKFLHHKASKHRSRSQVAGKQVGYRNIPIIEELRQLERDIMVRVNQTPRRSDDSKKWLDWPVFLACVEQLREECGPRTACGKKRSMRVLAQSHQVALIFMLLSAFPDRSRTLRELELGRTLFNRDGKWSIEQNAEDFKTGDSFCKNGQKRIIELPEALYPFLVEWSEQWRPILNPEHKYFFTKVNGDPLDAGSLYNYFRRRIYRLTGKLFTPHMVRDSIVTYLKLSGAADGVLAALAELMAHSQKTQAKIYDRRTPSQKVAPALEVLQSLVAGTLSSPTAQPMELVPLQKNVDRI